jgi:hypothetical protein
MGLNPHTLTEALCIYIFTLKKGKYVMNDNLIPFNELTEEEQRKLAQKGGQKSGEVRKAKKTMREMLDYLLEKQIKTNKGDMSTLEAIMVSMIAKASKGDVRATEFIRDTIGQKPTDKTEIIGQLPPLVVRELKDDTHNGNSDKVPAADTNQAQE